MISEAALQLHGWIIQRPLWAVEGIYRILTQPKQEGEADASN